MGGLICYWVAQNLGGAGIDMPTVPTGIIGLELPLLVMSRTSLLFFVSNWGLGSQFCSAFVPLSKREFLTS